MGLERLPYIMVWFHLSYLLWSEIPRKCEQHIRLSNDDQWTRDRDIGVSILFPSHRFLLTPSLTTLEFKLMMEWFVSVENTESKCLLRLEESFNLLRRMKILIWIKCGARFFLSVFLESIGILFPCSSKLQLKSSPSIQCCLLYLRRDVL